MKRAGILICVLFAAAPLLALDAYPFTSTAELGTSVG